MEQKMKSLSVNLAKCAHQGKTNANYYLTQTAGNTLIAIPPFGRLIEGAEMRPFSAGASCLVLLDGLLSITPIGKS
jgi:hypothetical protein